MTARRRTGARQPGDGTQQRDPGDPRIGDDLERALAYAREHELDGPLQYLIGARAQFRLLRGNWDGAEDDARTSLATASAGPGAGVAMMVLGRLRARRGDPDASATLDEAGRLDATGEPHRVAAVAAARAEHAWLGGDTPASSPRSAMSTPRAWPFATHSSTPSLRSGSGASAHAVDRLSTAAATRARSPVTRKERPRPGRRWASPTKPPTPRPTATRPRRSRHWRRSTGRRPGRRAAPAPQAPGARGAAGAARPATRLSRRAGRADASPGRGGPPDHHRRDERGDRPRARREPEDGGSPRLGRARQAGPRLAARGPSGSHPPRAHSDLGRGIAQHRAPLPMSGPGRARTVAGP